MREKQLLIANLRKLKGQVFEAGAEVEHQAKDGQQRDMGERIIEFSHWLEWLSDYLEEDARN